MYAVEEMFESLVTEEDYKKVQVLMKQRAEQLNKCKKEPTVFLHEFYSCEEALLEALFFADVATERIIINNN